MRRLRIVLFAVLALALVLYLVVPASFALYASLRKASDVGVPPEGFQEISLKTNDNIELAAWYRQPTNRIAVIILHGGLGSRDSIRGYAEALANCGFGILAIDIRGYGESEGGGNAFGWKSTTDIESAVSFLAQQPEVETICGLGISMGGESLLSAASACPEIVAIASDGSTHRSVSDYIALAGNRSLVRSWTTRVMYGALGLFTGDKPPTPIVDSIRQSGNTRFLLIAAGEEESECDYNSLFARVAGGRATVWKVPGVGHTKAFRRNRAEYIKRVSQFFMSSSGR